MDDIQVTTPTRTRCTHKELGCGNYQIKFFPFNPTIEVVVPCGHFKQWKRGIWNCGMNTFSPLGCPVQAKSWARPLRKELYKSVVLCMRRWVPTSLLTNERECSLPISDPRHRSEIFGRERVWNRSIEPSRAHLHAIVRNILECICKHSFLPMFVSECVRYENVPFLCFIYLFMFFYLNFLTLKKSVLPYNK